VTHAEFLSLRTGDVVRMRNSGVLRVVLHASSRAKYGGTFSITMLKLHGSWTDPCPFTSYTLTDGRLTLERTGWRLKQIPPEVLACPDPRHSHLHCADGTFVAGASEAA